MSIGNRIKLIRRVTPHLRAKNGSIGTVEDYDAGGTLYVRWDYSPETLQELNSSLDVFRVVESFPPPSDD
jgi:hypothetical protein